MRVVAAFASAVLWVCLGVLPSYAEKRVALVIGNNVYSNLPADQQLQKAVNDARAVGDALSGIGFQVIRGENLGRQALLAKFDELTQRLEPGDTAFFFFAGHGVAIGGGNYILPADVPNVGPGQDVLLARASLGENDIVSDLQGRGVRVAVVVLDACRNNPFKRPGVRAVGSDRGLGRIEPVRGVFTLYSAGIGQMALDGLGDADKNPNSVFTRVFAPALARPGVDLKELATEVREEVARLAASVRHDQRPAYYDETIGGPVYLAGLPREEKPPSVKPRDPCAAAADHWRSAEAIGNLAAFEDHLARFPNCTFAYLAKARIENLKSKVAVGIPALPEQDVHRFDRFWTVTLVCPNNPSGRLPGWTFQFGATVKDGIFRGQRGTEGKPGGQVFDGTIDPDGTTRIFAKGLSGNTNSDPFHRPTGTEFRYTIAGKLEGSHGRASRVDRDCDVRFVKR
jgi:Caspase domain